MPAKGQKKKEAETVMEQPENTTWDKERQKKVDLYFQRNLLGSDVPTGDPFAAPEYLHKKYPGMEFCLLPVDDKENARYKNPQTAWEDVPPLPGMKSASGRIQKGDSYWAMRPVEIGDAVRRHKEMLRDAAHGVSRPDPNFTQAELEDRVKHINRGLNRPLVSVGDGPEDKSVVVSDQEGIERHFQNEPQQERSEKRLFPGYGPSKIFGGNQT